MVMDILALIVVIVFALLIYFVPAAIAATRHHRYVTEIFLLNLLAGWSIIGWVAAFIWACVTPADAAAPAASPAASPRPASSAGCPFCGWLKVQVGDVACGRCGRKLVKA
jgi:hypothetical protein